MYDSAVRVLSEAASEANFLGPDEAQQMLVEAITTLMRSGVAGTVAGWQEGGGFGSG